MSLRLPFLRGLSVPKPFGAARLVLLVLGVLALAGCQQVERLTGSGPGAPAPQAQAPAQQPPAAAAPTAPLGVLPGQPPLALGKARVALLLPLSGPNAVLGQSLLSAAELALFASNSDSLELLPRDTEAQGATAAAKAALDAGAELILGPVFASQVSEIAPMTRARGVPVVAFSNDITVAGNGVFVLGISPEAQIDRVVSFAHSRGAQKFAALVPDSPYGRRTVGVLQAVASRIGAQVTRVARYTSADTQTLTPVIRQLADYDVRRAQLRAQKRALEAKSDDASKLALKRLEGVETSGDPDFDALLIPEGGEHLRAIAPLLSYYDIDTRHVRPLGTFDWNGPLTETEPALNGAWYPVPPPEPGRQFDAMYKKAFGDNPPRIASLAFDATLVAAVLARTEPLPGETRFALSRLTQPNGFSGAGGIFRLKPDGSTERGLAIMEVHLHASQIVSPAPTTFAPVASAAPTQ